MDKKITDKGWAAMRQLLDREMPVESRRRRLLGWWWLLLLPVSGYGAWYWMEKSTVEPPVEPMHMASLAPIARADQKASPNESEFPLTVNSTQNHTTASAETLPIQSKTQQTRFPNDSEQHQAHVIVLENAGQDFKHDLSPELIPANTSHLHESDLGEKMEARPEVLNLTNLATTLKPIDFHFENQLNPSLVATGITPEPATGKRSNYWQWGAMTTLATERFKSINGFSAGLNLDWHFAKKWGFRSGLSYNFHRLETQKRPVASVRTSEYRSKVDGNLIIEDLVNNTAVANEGIGYYADSLANNVLIPVGKMQRLEVPVTLFWSPTRRLKIFGGASFARTLSTKADRENYSGAYVLRLADKSAEDDASRLSSGELANWNTDAIFGSSFLFGKFELGLNAKIPFNKTIGRTFYDNPGLGNWGSIRYTPSNQRAATFSLYGIYHF